MVPNPWVIIAAIIGLLAASIVGYLKGSHDGKVQIEALWQTREAAINAQAANKISEAAARVAAIEHAHADEINAVDTKYQTKLREKENALALALNAAKYSGLYAHTTCPAVSGNPTGGPVAPSGIGDGSPRVKLPDEDARFLLSEADRADKIVEQLTACQAVIRSDRSAK